MIAVTVYAMNADKGWSPEAGVNDYTTRPVGAEDLMERIEQWTATDPVSPG
jgi:CheY-like chemotaxis protein